MKINKPPIIQQKLNDEFDVVIGFMEQEEDAEVTGIVTKGKYTPKDLNSDSEISWSIVANAIFVTELVEIKFSKEDTKLEFRVLLQKVTNKMAICNATLDNLDAL